MATNMSESPWNEDADPCGSDRVQELVRLGRALTLPEKTRAKVLEASRELRSACRRGEGQPKRVPSKGASRSRAHGPAGTALLTRGGFLRLAAVAAGAGAVFMAGSVIRHEGDVADAAKDGFALRAYAEGTPQDDGTTRVLSRFGGAGSISGGDDNRWMVSCDLDLGCTGANIASLAFALEGGYAEAGLEDDRQLYFVQESNQDVKEGERVPYERNTSFSVSYDEQGNDQEPRVMTRKVQAIFPETEEIAAVSDELDKMMGGEEADKGWDDLEVASVMEFANMLSQSTLRITAIMRDGSAQEHAYAMAPVPDFEDRYRSYTARRDEAYQSAASESGTADVEVPALYYITMLE